MEDIFVLTGYITGYIDTRLKDVLLIIWKTGKNAYFCEMEPAIWGPCCQKHMIGEKEDLPNHLLFWILKRSQSSFAGFTFLLKYLQQWPWK